MNNQVVEFVRWASNLSVIIPFIVYLPKISKYPTQNHIVGGMIILSGLADAASFYHSSAIVFNLYQVLLFFSTTWFFYELVYKKKSEFIALVSIGVYLSVLIFSVVRYGLYQNYSSLWVTGAIISVIHATVYVFNIPRMVIDRYFDNNLLSNMIFTSSMFIFFFVAGIVYFLYDPISKAEEINTLKAFWSIHNAFNILKHLGFALAFYYTGKRSIYMTLEQLNRIAQQLEEEKDGIEK
jgi:hypothetical protein